MTTENLYLGKLGVNPDQTAEFTEPLQMDNLAARFLQIKIVNTQGRAELRGLRVFAAVSGHANEERKEARQF